MIVCRKTSNIAVGTIGKAGFQYAFPIASLYALLGEAIAREIMLINTQHTARSLTPEPNATTRRHPLLATKSAAPTR